MLPRRADPVAGALAGTFVLAALFALPVAILGLIVWMARRANRSTSSAPRPEVDAEFSSRFQELEDSILDANATTRPQGRRRRRRETDNP